MIFGLTNFVRIDSLINKSKLVLPVAIILKSSGYIVQDWLCFLMLLNGGHDNGKLVLCDKPRCSLTRTGKCLCYVTIVESGVKRIHSINGSNITKKSFTKFMTERIKRLDDCCCYSSLFIMND